MDKYAIFGDVHGCYIEFIDLLHAINFFEEPRKLISCGDLLDKNPGEDNYKKLLKFFRDWDSAVVLGNHEEKQIRFEDRDIKEQKTGRKNQMAPAKDPEKYPDFWATRKQLLELQKEGWDPFHWFRQFSYYYYVPGYDYCVIHGGLEPGKKPEEMLEKVICRVRNVKSNGRMAHLSEITDDMPFWTELYEGETKIVYGHAPVLEPRITHNTIGLDTGCAYGNKLSALLLPEETIVSVDAKKMYTTQDYGWLEK